MLARSCGCGWPRRRAYRSRWHRRASPFERARCRTSAPTDTPSSARCLPWGSRSVGARSGEAPPARAQAAGSRPASCCEDRALQPPVLSALVVRVARAVVADIARESMDQRDTQTQQQLRQMMMRSWALSTWRRACGRPGMNQQAWQQPWCGPRDTLEPRPSDSSASRSCVGVGVREEGERYEEERE